MRYDILLANLYFKNIHQSEDFQEGRGMNLESVVELAELGGCGVWGGEAGEEGGVGKPIHLSLQALAGATAAALQRRKRRRRPASASTSHRHRSMQRESRGREREVPLLFRGLSSRGKLVSESRMVFTGAAIVPPICRDTERPPCTDKSTAAGSEFNTFPATVITVIGNWDRCGISFHCEENREKIICNLCKKFLQLLNKYCVV